LLKIPLFGDYRKKSILIFWTYYAKKIKQLTVGSIIQKKESFINKERWCLKSQKDIYSLFVNLCVTAL
jgi:hypothetical protein